MPAQIVQIRIVLDRLEKREGKDAVAAVLKMVGATDADSIKPQDYREVMQLCGHPELADAVMTCRVDDQNKPRDGVQDGLAKIARRVYGTDKRPNDDFKTVVNSAPSLKEGLDLAARAIHLRRER